MRLNNRDDGFQDAAATITYERERKNYQEAMHAKSKQSVTTKPGKMPSHVKHAYQQREQRDREQQQKELLEQEGVDQEQQDPPPKEQNRRRILGAHDTRTRAQGNFGPPKKTIVPPTTVSDDSSSGSNFEGMDESELMRALSENPELAEKYGVPTSPKGRKQLPAHVKELMDGGIPIFSWAVVLLLVMALMWFVYKTTRIPTKKQSGHKIKSSKGKPAKKVKKQQTKKVVTVQKPQEEDNHGNVHVARSMTPAATPKKASTVENLKPEKKGAAQKKKKQKKSPKQVGAKVDTEVTNGRSAETGEPDKEAVAEIIQAPIHLTSDGDEDDGWHTVSKGASRTAKVVETRATPPSPLPPFEAAVEPQSKPEETSSSKATAVSAAAAAAAPANPSASSVVADSPVIPPEKVENTSEPVPDLKAEAVNGENQTQNKGKTQGAAKKKSKTVDAKTTVEKDAGATPAKPKTTKTAERTTEDDAALAAMLQKQEENFARAGNTDNEETVWEEVPARRRKGSGKV